MFNPQSNRVLHQRPRGFTLVELLVVIVIISILAALITPAVVGALSTARRGRISQEIALLDGALKTYKSDHGSYPPSNGAEFRTHLTRKYIYGGSDVTTTNIPNNLRGAEILVYCLGGNQLNRPGNFSTDKRAPITGTSKKPALFDFDQSRLQTFPSGTGPTEYPTSNCSATDGSNFFPVYMPPYPSTKNAPYVYFCSSRASSATESYVVPTTNSSTVGQYGTARPYIVDQAAGAPPALANATSFQILAPGEDGSFGTETAAPLLTATALTGTPPTVFPAIPGGKAKFCKVWVDTSSNPPKATYYYHAVTEDDDMSNVFTGRLEDNKP